MGFIHYKQQAKVAPELLWATNQGAWNAIEQLRALAPKAPPRGGAVLISNDPFGGSFQMMFITRLYFHDPELHVDLDRYGSYTSHYDLKLSFENGKLVQR